MQSLDQVFKTLFWNLKQFLLESSEKIWSSVNTKCGSNLNCFAEKNVTWLCGFVPLRFTFVECNSGLEVPCNMSINYYCIIFSIMRRLAKYWAIWACWLSLYCINNMHGWDKYYIVIVLLLKLYWINNVHRWAKYLV